MWFDMCYFDHTDVAAAAGWSHECAAPSGGHSPAAPLYDQSGSTNHNERHPSRKSAAHYSAAGTHASAAAAQHSHTGGTHTACFFLNAN